MIHWFLKPGRKRALLLSAPVMVLSFILLNPALSSREFEAFSGSEPARDADGDGMNDAYEIFFGLDPSCSDDAGFDYDGDGLANLEESGKLTDPFCRDTDRDGFSDNLDGKISRAYLRWGAPQFTSGDEYEYAHPAWLLGAYRAGGEWFVDAATTQSCWRVTVGTASLNVDLDRAILTNNLRYAVHYFYGRAGAARSAVSGAALVINLLDTNGNFACCADGVTGENLFGNLLEAGNGAVVSSNAGTYSNRVALVFSIPTAEFPEAAVIQLKAYCAGKESSAALAEEEEGIIVYEGLLYIDEDGDGLDADQERQLGTSDYRLDSNNNGTNDYDECFNTGSSTNHPDEDGDDEGNDEEDDTDKSGKIIYVDQAVGDDQFTGRSSGLVSREQAKGPKKTVGAGLAIAGRGDTLVIKPGNYGEDLNISGKNIKVIIEGKVRL